MAKSRLSMNDDGTVKGICDECNKNMSVAVIGGSKCSHQFVLHRFGTDNVDVIEIKKPAVSTEPVKEIGTITVHPEEK